MKDYNYFKVNSTSIIECMRLVISNALTLTRTQPNEHGVIDGIANNLEALAKVLREFKS